MDELPSVIPLTEAKKTQPYRIVFISPRGNAPLDRLAVLGILPGTDVRLWQKRPSYVLRTGETDVAIDEELARAIYVRNGIKGEK